MALPELIADVKSMLTPALIAKLGAVLLTILAVYIAYRLTRKHLRRFAERVLKIQNVESIEKAVYYLFVIGVVIYILNLFGVNLSALLGAAGIASVAIGFAAQTSFSNIISGFFVVSEHSLKIGDFITIDEVSGTVQSIDLLSVKILTTDNQMVRVPNETIIKSNLINTTYFPQRRLTVRVTVALDSNLQLVNDMLLKTARSYEKVLEDPPPVVIFDRFAESGVEVLLGVWFKKENFLDVKNAMYMGIHRNLAAAGIVIPFRQVDVRVKDSVQPFVSANAGSVLASPRTKSSRKKTVK